MKRKITCMLLALMLVISLLPMGAIHANASSNLNYSENVVNLIKQFEGFQAVAYWDVNQWTIGYGTPGYQNQVISQAEADLALRSSLNQINDRINQFAASNNLYLTQNKHDALVSFSFNCGTEWTTQGGRFFDAVTKYTSVDQFLFAISLWANVGTTPDANLLNRRMSEANLYLNGIYSASAPSAYTYVIFNPNGGVAGNGGEDKMQGYQAGSNVQILVGNPTKTGYSFGGWFTSPTGGASVKTLTSANARGTLYAQYGIPASVITTTSLRNSASINSHVVGTVNAGTQIVIVETTTHSNLNWGRTSDGWVELSATNYTGGQVTPVQPTGINAGTVRCNTGVNIRSGAGTNYSVVGAARNGERVTIYEINNNWGRIGDGRWISLQYVTLDNSSSSTSGITWDDGTTTPSTGFGTQGTVTASVLNVRQTPGINGALVGKLPQGSVVTVYEQSIVGNAPWGRIGTNQWVCLNYVSMSSAPTPSPSPAPSGDVIATGTVVSYTKLNVRSGAGTSAPLIGSLMPNTPVSIYEKVTVNGADWGRIGSASQWVCLAYVNISGQPTPTPTPAPTTGTGTVISVGDLNVRTGPGTNYAKYGVLPSGSTVTITEVVTNGNQQWGKLESGLWVCMTYIRMNGTPTPTPTPTSNTGRVTTGLNVRQYAGTNYPIVAKLTAGTTVTVYETTVVNGVSWGRIGTNQWVCMNYVQMMGGSGINWQ